MRVPRPRYPVLSLSTTLLFLAPAPTLAAATAPPVARRYVALSAHDGPCPGVDGWTQTSLFNPRSRPPTRGDGSKPSDPPQKRSHAVPVSGSPSRDPGAASPMPRALARYCSYTWDGKGAGAEPPSTERDKFANKRKFVRADPDYDVLLPQGSVADDPAVKLALNTAFRTMLGLRPLKQSIYEARDAQIARVAVIDTAPDSTDPLAVPGSYARAPAHVKHGLAMAEIINEVRCPARESACRRNLFFADSFPWRGKIDGPHRAAVPGSSAHLGSLGSLAAAIVGAVDRWRAENAARGTNSPLVLNLSLGWDTRWAPKEWSFEAWDIPANDSDEQLVPRGNWPATAQSVHAALVYASCFDVLVIAASGNNTAGGYEQLIGTAPGKWEQLLAPDRATCVRLFGEKTLPAELPDVGAITVKRRPLVYAASAQMSAAGGRIAMARMDGTPPRMLAGAHVVAGRDKNGNALTEAWTGTSVAAAVLSGLAANVWTYDPRLSSHHVMALLDDPANGKNTQTGATLVGDNSGAESPHSSTTAAYSPIPVQVFEALCKHRPDCPEYPYAKAYTQDTFQAYVEIINYHAVAAAVAAACASSGSNTLTATVEFTRKILNGNPTQRTLFYPADGTLPRTAGDNMAEPWMRPQPETPICPVCPLNGTTLVLSINKALLPQLKKAGQTEIELDNPLLEFRVPGIDGFATVSLGKVTVSVDKPTLIPLENYKLDGASLSFLAQLGNGQSGTLTVFVTDSANRVVPLVSLVPVYR